MDEFTFFGIEAALPRCKERDPFLTLGNLGPVQSPEPGARGRGGDKVPPPQPPTPHPPHHPGLQSPANSDRRRVRKLRSTISLNANLLLNVC